MKTPTDANAATQTREKSNPWWWMQPPRNDARGTVPNMFLAAISLAALLALARVAVDGRRQRGYGIAARLLAAIGFIALCAVLWALGPML